MPPPTTIAGQLVNGVVLLAQTGEHPSPDDWEEVVRIIRSTHGLKPKAVIISSEGGAPTAVQRQELRDVLSRIETSVERMPKMVLLTDSNAALFAVSTLRLFLRHYPVPYKPADWPRAAMYLGLSPDEMSFYVAKLRELRSTIRPSA
jgi:hypothetical protein